MAKSPHTLSRRRFIQLTAISAAGVFIPNPVFADQAILPFRQDARLLPLHFNENSLGMSPKAQKAAIDATIKFGNRYADDLIGELRHQLANLHKVSTEQIILGNGSTQVIGAVVARAAKMGAQLVEPDPTFGDARRYAKVHGVPVHRVAVGQGFVTDIKAMQEKVASLKGPVLVNLCNPNNPTGTIIERNVLQNWIIQAPDHITFLIDEAYHDYAVANKNYASAEALIQSGRENVIISRTFSKIYGMAGMRVGYGVAAQKTALETRKFATDFNLNAPGVAAAIASLQDPVYYQHSLSSNLRGKEILLSALDELGLQAIPSNTNFVLHQISAEVTTYQQRMLKNAVKVGRKMTHQTNWNRLSIGTPEQMAQFVETLKAFRVKGWV